MSGNTGEPSTKRQKIDMVDDSDSVFVNFLKDKTKVQILHNAYIALKNGLSMMNLCILKIEETNARISEGFSRASCYTTKYELDGKTKTFETGRIFLFGLAVLKEFTNETNPRIPEDKVQRSALAKLLKFMYLDHSVLFEQDCKEGECALRLAQHLLSPLSVATNYTIDCYPDLVGRDNNCPCKEKDKLVGKIGDTTFGCSRGWHGKTDILMDDLLPVELTGLPSDEWSEDVSVSSSTEFLDKDIKQIIAQTIVFSFLQHRYNKGKMKNFLVPGIGISAKKIIGYFYDCQEDVLLATVPMNLHADRPELSIYAVVFLWLTINYKIFCSGITDEMKNFKADFFKRVDDFIDVYRNEVTRPVHKSREESKKDEYDWAINPGGEGGVNVEDYGIKFIKPFQK